MNCKKTGIMHRRTSRGGAAARVNTFFTSLDKVLAEIENQFSRNDQDVLCALGDVTRVIHPPVIALTQLLNTIISTRSYIRQNNACSIDSRNT